MLLQKSSLSLTDLKHELVLEVARCGGCHVCLVVVVLVVKVELASAAARGLHEVRRGEAASPEMRMMMRGQFKLIEVLCYFLFEIPPFSSLPFIAAGYFHHIFLPFTISTICPFRST